MATKIDHVDEGVSRPAQCCSILGLTFLFWVGGKVVNSSWSARMAFLLASVFSSGVSGCARTFQSSQSPLMVHLVWWQGQEGFGNYLPLMPPAWWEAPCSPGLLDFPGLPMGDPRLGHDLPLTWEEWAVCDECTSRFTIVLRKEFKLEDFTHYLDYDFLGVT